MSNIYEVVDKIYTLFPDSFHKIYQGLGLGIGLSRDVGSWEVFWENIEGAHDFERF